MSSTRSTSAEMPHGNAPPARLVMATGRGRWGVRDTGERRERYRGRREAGGEINVYPLVPPTGGIRGTGGGAEGDFTLDSLAPTT